MSDLRDRFDEPTGADMLRFSSSLAVDLRMLDEDIDGSIAHATMLGECGLIAADEARELTRGLERVRREITDGSWTPPADAEDIHMAVEARLIETCGDVGRKLHTARSRNDQVATDVRLWLKGRGGRLDAALGGLIATLLDRVDRDGQTLLPGFTHLQRGQPVLLGHQLLAHAWALDRDRGRLRDALARLDRSPLGACAMAGTPHPIDRDRTAALLGFAAPVENAMDAVAARDHELEVAAACAICAGHLSRMADELVLWSSSEFRLVRLSSAYATGSSIMPQKRNPDAAELVRGKTALVPGRLQSLLAMTRALPLAYNRDLQETREPLFDSLDTTIECVAITAAMWRTLEVHAERYEETLDGDFSLATEIADYLASEGVPFREAHAVVGRIVRHCEDNGTDLAGLSRETARTFHAKLDIDLTPWISARNAVERRTSLGGTCPTEIRRQVALLRERA